MAYITIDDFKMQIQELFLEEVTESDSLLIDEAIALAEEEVFSYLDQRYDAAVEFAKTGSARNAKTKHCAIAIALYHLHCRVTPNQVPAVRNDRYVDSIDWLKDVANGKINPRLEVKVDPNTEDQTALFRMGSNQKFNSEY